MKIGFLNAYHWDNDPESYQAEYAPMYEKYFRKIAPENWKFITYEVAQGDFPKSIDECDGWTIGGSGKSCYEKDSWIIELGQLVKSIDEAKKPLLGICFGHQMIAHALGGEVKKSDKGWGVGVRSFDVFASPKWMKQSDNFFGEHLLLFSHQDQVLKLPSGCENLAKDDFCPVQIYSKENHIFSIQGHPEFTTEFALGRMNSRIEKIGQDVYDVAKASLERETTALQIGSSIVEFFAQKNE